MRCNAIRLVLLMLVFVFAANLRDAQADVSVGVSLFYDDLAPHGDWFEMENYGWVWTPRHVAADWRPYTRGRWVFSDDDGWLWASDEEGGWATCHYGRWFFDDRYGWVWVPGRDWAPAWVAWRFGGGYVGWAPLPPQFRSNAGVGFRVGDVDFDAWLTPRQYVFVPERHFVDSRVYREVVSPARNWTIVNVTQPVTNYGVRQNRLVNRSLSVEQVEGHLGRAVPRVRVVEEHMTPPRRAEVKEGTVRVFRPTVRSESSARPRSARASGNVPRVKPHPAEPSVEGADVRRPERPTASLQTGQGRAPAPSRSVTSNPGDVLRKSEAEARREQQIRQRQSAELEVQRDRQREEERARARSEDLQKHQERQQQALHERQAKQERQLQQKQGQELEREARERRGQRQAQLQREQSERRLELQQKQERDHQVLRDKQARQQQQLQEKQRKQQAQADESKRKQQQREAQADEKRKQQQQRQAQADEKRKQQQRQEDKSKKASNRPANPPPS
jgi:Family of unknown function (DUF6600)